MPKSQYTKVLYEKLVDFFRANGPRYPQAAKACGCSANIAQTAFEKGWRGLVWATAIEQVLADEAEAARAARMKAAEEQARVEEEVRLAARRDAAIARKQEAQGAQISRSNALNVAVATAKLLNSMHILVAEVEARLKGGDAQSMTMVEMRKWLHLIPQAVKDAQTTMQMALQIERVVTGEPIAVLGVRVDQMSPTQMVQQLQNLQKTMERANALPPEIMEADIVDG